MGRDHFEVVSIGSVESSLTDVNTAPLQGDEGAPDAWLHVDPKVLEGLQGIDAGQELFVLTWLHLARRDVLRVRPRGDLSRSEEGVFNTRSPDRPNPIGLHRVEVLGVEGHRLRVSGLEAVHGTPLLDLKPVLTAVADR